MKSSSSFSLDAALLPFDDAVIFDFVCERYIVPMYARDIFRWWVWLAVLLSVVSVTGSVAFGDEYDRKCCFRWWVWLAAEVQCCFRWWVWLAVLLSVVSLTLIALTLTRASSLITSEVPGKQQRTEPRRFFKKSSSLPLVLTTLLVTASSPHCLFSSLPVNRQRVDKAGTLPSSPPLFCFCSFFLPHCFSFFLPPFAILCKSCNIFIVFCKWLVRTVILVQFGLLCTMCM